VGLGYCSGIFANLHLKQNELGLGEVTGNRACAERRIKHRGMYVFVL
jgi:hypothetical protein